MEEGDSDSYLTATRRENMATSTIPNMLNGLIKRQTFSATYSSLAAGAEKLLTKTDFDYSIPSGYVPCGVIRFTSGNASVILRLVDVYDSSTNLMGVRNVGSSAASGTCTIIVTFIKSSAL